MSPPLAGSLVPGLLIVLVFAVLAGLMITRRMPALLALPLMAVAVGVIAGIAGGLPWSPPAAPVPPPAGFVPPESLQGLLFDTILSKGSALLAELIMYAIFGAILSQVVMRQGIAQRLVRLAAEYAGDHKMLLALLMGGVIAVAFSSLTGLGAVIMIGSLALPIMIGSGLSPLFSACIMLFAISLGGIFSPVNQGFFKEVLRVDLPTVVSYAAGFGTLFAITTAAFIAVGAWRERRRFGWAVAVEPPAPVVPLPAMITPAIPVLLVMLPGLHWPIIPAFVVGIVYGLLTTQPSRVIPNLTACVLEGLKDMAPVIGLFMGIGMMLAAIRDPLTSTIMTPFLHRIIPTTPLGFVVFFTLLAPLALYRGPLNVVGMGAGIATLVITTGMLTPVAVMAAFLAVGQVQGVCDPTNTYNVWLAQFTHTSTEELLKKTLPFVWVFVLVALIYAVAVRHVVGP